jgi:hypothetical protein
MYKISILNCSSIVEFNVSKQTIFYILDLNFIYVCIFNYNMEIYV